MSPYALFVWFVILLVALMAITAVVEVLVDRHRRYGR